MHYIDAGVDTGDKIAQKRVPVDPVDTGETLYRKLELASVDLFKETWPLIRARKATRTPQNAQDASYHRAQDVGQIDEISLDDTYKAGELIDIIRALTFPPYPGAYFWEAGRKVYIRCQLLYEEDL